MHIHIVHMCMHTHVHTAPYIFYSTTHSGEDQVIPLYGKFDILMEGGKTFPVIL